MKLVKKEKSSRFLPGYYFHFLKKWICKTSTPGNIHQNLCHSNRVSIIILVNLMQEVKLKYTIFDHEKTTISVERTRRSCNFSTSDQLCVGNAKIDMLLGWVSFLLDPPSTNCLPVIQGHCSILNSFHFYSKNCSKSSSSLGFCSDILMCKKRSISIKYSPLKNVSYNFSLRDFLCNINRGSTFV